MIIVLIIGLSLISWSIIPCLKLWLFYPYKKVPIHSISAEYTHHQEGALAVIDIYTVHVLYSYCYADNIYKSTKVSFFGAPKFISHQNLQLYLDKIEKMNECLVSIKNPENSVLTMFKNIGDRNTRSGSFGAGLIIVGFYLLLLHIAN